MFITGQQLKTRGATAIGQAIKTEDDTAIIQVRGRSKYFVAPIEHYEEFREYQILKAYEAVQEDIKNGDYKIQTPEEHFAELGI